jgi:hypothetical protein
MKDFLFDYQVYCNSDSNFETDVPFSVFALSQQGSDHQARSLGNQDACSVYIGKSAIVGAVADGCSTGQNLNGLSYNQVGAHLGSYLATRIVRKLVLKHQLAPQEIKPKFEAELLKAYKRMLRVFSPWKSEKTDVLLNFFSSTIIFFVLTKDSYAVYRVGDGDVYLNGELKEGDHTGYFTNALIEPKLLGNNDLHINPQYSLESVGEGEISNLESLFICSDGFSRQMIAGNKRLQRFFFESHQSKSGFWDRRSEFRRELQEVLKDQSHDNWPTDDATFISVTQVK